ncbi:mating-type switching protein swi10 [Physcia stellaris]|nr:mating-type switching protein swi10 [Physcia stellaris]
MDDEFGDDADFAAVFEAVTPKATAVTPNAPKIQQPKPQALPNRTAPSSILVSSRQKGNPILNSVRSLPWEYSDIPADFVLGNTTCAFFLSLKYHRLHPEYIYTRIRALGGKYNLRILLTMVDIQNHEDSLKELSKTSLVNNLTLILCWSAQEAGRYLELYKSFEHASPTSIRAHQSTSYSDKLVEFITVPRSINKTDAVGLVSAFGSIRNAINARPEEIGTIAGWGEKKVQRWCQSVREPFRVRKAARRGIERTESSLGLPRGDSSADLQRDVSSFEDGQDQERIDTTDERFSGEAPLEGEVNRDVPEMARMSKKRTAAELSLWNPGEDEEEALLLAAAEEEVNPQQKPQFAGDVLGKSPSTQKTSKDSRMSEGMIAALAKLRDQ